MQYRLIVQHYAGVRHTAKHPNNTYTNTQAQLTVGLVSFVLLTCHLILMKALVCNNHACHNLLYNS